MIEHLLALYEKNLDYARRLVADVPDEKLAHQPAPRMNHPAWVLGHLARAADFTLAIFEQQPLCPPEWAKVYGRDSQPTSDRGAYGSKAELLHALERAHQHVSAALRCADWTRLDGPPAENYRARFPTKWQLLIHMMTGHEQMHLGQLSAWRRVQGMPSV